MLPAAETTMFAPVYMARWYAPIARRLTVEMTSAVPITGRPSACVPKTDCEKRSCTSSCGVSSYIAISSRTTSRSWSSSANAGAKTMSVITSSASSTCLSGTRAYTTVCSREVAAFSSAPIASKISAICCASYDCEPLNSRCSMKCETPARSSFSSREPAPIQNPSDTERTLGTFSEITRSPLSSSDSTYFCTCGSYRGLRDELDPAAASLRFIQRLVRETEQHLRVSGVVGAARDPEARTQPGRLRGDARDDFARVVLVRFGEHERELVAADPERVVALAHGGLQRAR